MNQHTKEEGHGNRHTGPEIGGKRVEYTKVEWNHYISQHTQQLVNIVCGKHMSIMHPS